MGTSKSNISKKIKQLLKDKPLTDLSLLAPDISKKILTNKEITSNLLDENELISSFEVISKHFNNLSTGGFKGKSKRELLEDPITLEEFLNMILDEIDENDFLEKELLEKAYKIAMTACLEVEEFDINSFVHLLFYHLINQILKKDLYDTLKQLYDELPYSKINQIINDLTDQIINRSIYELVEQFINRKAHLKDVVNKIVSETSNTTLGEF